MRKTFETEWWVRKEYWRNESQRTKFVCVEAENERKRERDMRSRLELRCQDWCACGIEEMGRRSDRCKFMLVSPTLDSYMVFGRERGWEGGGDVGLQLSRVTAFKVCASKVCLCGGRESDRENGREFCVGALLLLRDVFHF